LELVTEIFSAADDASAVPAADFKSISAFKRPITAASLDARKTCETNDDNVCRSTIFKKTYLNKNRAHLEALSSQESKRDLRSNQRRVRFYYNIGFTPR
jgi:hypothetical protein